jgi:hypothetical protein
VASFNNFERKYYKLSILFIKNRQVLITTGKAEKSYRTVKILWLVLLKKVKLLEKME